MARVNRAARQLGIEAALLALCLAGLALAIRALPVLAPARSAAWGMVVDGVTISGTLTPAQYGLNQLDVTLSDAGAAELEAAFYPIGGGALVARRTLTATGTPGQYRAAGLALTRAGDWQLLVSVRRPGAAIAYGRVDWNLGPDGGVWRADEARPWYAGLLGGWNAFGALGLSGLGLMVLAVWGRRAWRLWRQAGDGER